MTLHLVVQQLRQAKFRTEKQLSGINLALHALGAPKKPSASTGPRRVLSAAARKKISVAQRDRWAKWHKQNGKAA